MEHTYEVVVERVSTDAGPDLFELRFYSLSDLAEPRVVLIDSERAANLVKDLQEELEDVPTNPMVAAIISTREIL